MSLVRPAKNVRCIKCSFFDVVPDCDHCAKCLPLEISKLIDLSNIEILKIVSGKKLLLGVN